MVLGWSLCCASVVLGQAADGQCHCSSSHVLLHRARHYIHIPVHFRPEAVGRFEALLVIQTDEGKSIAIRLIGESLGKS
jgi:hypothetical protein